MSQITVTGTADQIRRLGTRFQDVANAATNPSSVTITFDNAVTNSFVAITGSDGKVRHG